MNNFLQIVELAKLIKYPNSDKLFASTLMSDSDSYYVQLCLLQRWLMFVHNIHINVHWSGKFDVYVKNDPMKILNTQVKLESYELALEHGLMFALNYIKENGTDSSPVS